MDKSESTSGLMIRVRWEGNGSKCYNGRVQEIAAKHVLPKDVTGQVGATIRIKWGRRIWYAVVVGLQAEEGSVAPLFLNCLSWTKVTCRPRKALWLPLFLNGPSWTKVQCNLQAEEGSVAPRVSKRPKLDQGNFVLTACPSRKLQLSVLHVPP